MRPAPPPARRLPAVRPHRHAPQTDLRRPRARPVRATVRPRNSQAVRPDPHLRATVPPLHLPHHVRAAAPPRIRGVKGRPRNSRAVRPGRRLRVAHRPPIRPVRPHRSGRVRGRPRNSRVGRPGRNVPPTRRPRIRLLRPDRSGRATDRPGPRGPATPRRRSSPVGRRLRVAAIRDRRAGRRLARDRVTDRLEHNQAADRPEHNQVADRPEHNQAADRPERDRAADRRKARLRQARRSVPGQPRARGPAMAPDRARPHRRTSPGERLRRGRVTDLPRVRHRRVPGPGHSPAITPTSAHRHRPIPRARVRDCSAHCARPEISRTRRAVPAQGPRARGANPPGTHPRTPPDGPAPKPPDPQGSATNRRSDHLHRPIRRPGPAAEHPPDRGPAAALDGTIRPHDPAPKRPDPHDWATDLHSDRPHRPIRQSGPATGPCGIRRPIRSDGSARMYPAVRDSADRHSSHPRRPIRQSGPAAGRPGTRGPAADRYDDRPRRPIRLAAGRAQRWDRAPAGPVRGHS